MKTSGFTFCIALLVGTATAGAHTGHWTGDSFTNGLAHPLFGLDHLLAMLALGIWAGQLGGRSRWLVPLAFAGAMLGGGVLEMCGVGIPFQEPGISLSVVLVGLAILFSIRPGPWIPAVAAGLFAVWHGAAHGAEIPPGTYFPPYALGFALATLGLHAVGVLLGETLSAQADKAPLRPVGAALAAAGIFLLAAQI